MDLHTPHAAVKHVMFMTSLSRAQIYALERAGEFPARHPRSATRGAWLEAQICTWMQHCADTRRVYACRPATIINATDHFLNKKQLFQLTGLSETTIHQHEISGAFPSRFKITKTRVAWLHREVMDWKNSLRP